MDSGWLRPDIHLLVSHGPPLGVQEPPRQLHRAEMLGRYGRGSSPATGTGEPRLVPRADADHGEHRPRRTPTPDPLKATSWAYAKKKHWETVARKHIPHAIERGVRVAMGTDCGIAAHGTNLREPAYLVESGMTPMGAILAGTSEAAELLGPAHEIGTPEPGKRADLVIARGNSPTGIAPPRQARERPARGEGRRALQGHGRPRSLTVICHTNGRGPGASSIRALISTREHITASVGGRPPGATARTGPSEWRTTHAPPHRHHPTRRGLHTGTQQRLVEDRRVRAEARGLRDRPGHRLDPLEADSGGARQSPAQGRLGETRRASPARPACSRAPSTT